MNIVETIKAWVKSMEQDDIRFIVLTLTSVIMWWAFVGRKRYGTKGMR